MLLMLEASNFFTYYEILKMKFSARSCLRILAAIWLESSLERLLTSLHYFNEREHDWTSRYKRVYHSALQAMKHGSREQP